MASKQLAGSGCYATNTDIKMKIPVQESYLPVENVKEPNHEIPKEMLYSHDARNMHFQFTVGCSDGKNQSEVKMEMGKEGMAAFFEQIEKIQDQLNSYL